VLKKAGVLLRSRGKEKKVVRKFVRRLDPTRDYAIGIAYTHNPDIADRLYSELGKSRTRIKYIYKVQAAAVLGAHAGPGTFCLWALAEP
jgi:fatty acid-binding protein DegV